MNGWRWWRIAEARWADPLDPSYAQARGGRWNPPNSFPTLYLNEDLVTARLNLRRFIADWPYEPEDLRADTGPVLVGATLPRAQGVCDAHSPKGIEALHLPRTYPFERSDRLVGHERCQAIGRQVKNLNLRGVRARSTAVRDGAGRELAWFPASARSWAHKDEVLDFEAWYWG